MKSTNDIYKLWFEVRHGLDSWDGDIVSGIEPQPTASMMTEISSAFLNSPILSSIGCRPLKLEKLSEDDE